MTPSEYFDEASRAPYLILSRALHNRKRQCLPKMVFMKSDPMTIHAPTLPSSGTQHLPTEGPLLPIQNLIATSQDDLDEHACYSNFPACCVSWCRWPRQRQAGSRNKEAAIGPEYPVLSPCACDMLRPDDQWVRHPVRSHFLEDVLG